MKIAFVIPTLGAGGAERVAATLCNQWHRTGHTVHLITFESPGERPHYALPPDLEVTRLDIMRAGGTATRAVGNIGRVMTLRRELRACAPDATVSFMTATNVVTLLASAGAPWPTVVSERVHVPAHAFGRIWNLLRRWTYPRADALVVQTKATAEWAMVQLGIAAEVIPNPVDVARFRGTCDTTTDDARRLLVAVGRLDPQKGFDLLIKAFADVADRLANWDVAIYGQGDQRPELQAMIEEAGMAHRISLPGVVKDIAAVYARAAAVVHPTRYEGYPNVIAEALAAGRPIIATDCPGGTSELLGGGKFGVLIANDDVETLRRALLDTLSSPERLAQLSCAARSANTLHEPALIADRWTTLLQRVVAAKQNR